MQAIIDTKMLTGALSRHIKFMAVQVSTPVLAGVRITVSDGEMRLITFDYEISVTSSMDVAGAVEGEVLVSARMLADTLAKFDPKTPVLFIADDENATRLTVAQGRTKATLALLPLDEYPSLPQNEYSTVFSTDGKTLADIASSCVPAAGKDATYTLPVMTALSFTLSGTGLTVAATDRYRFAVLEREVKDVVGGEGNALIPASTVKILAGMFKKCGTVYVRFGSSTADSMPTVAYFEVNGTVIVTRLLEGSLPAYSSLFPKQFWAEYDMQRPDATKAAQLAASACTRNTPIRITFSETAAMFEGGASDDAVISSEIDAKAASEGKGETMVAFNPVYFLEGLKCLPDDHVKISITSPTKPAVMTSPDVPGYRYLIMPVRISM